MKKYTKEHEWVELDSEGTALMGISEFAQGELGDLVFVELPKLQTFKKGEVMCVIESVKSASDIYAPFDLEVVAVNGVLDGAPELVNQHAETDGWIAKVKPLDESGFDEMLSEQDYKAMLNQ